MPAMIMEYDNCRVNILVHIFTTGSKYKVMHAKAHIAPNNIQLNIVMVFMFLHVILAFLNA